MAPTKVIIDTDPGIDDINALLLALSANPDDIEVLLISVTYGNVDVQKSLPSLRRPAAPRPRPRPRALLID
ncbi:MAG: hypothetical protein LQ340_005348 [Diploschistes diacapsis]|nr:MAG: hypothetical protein LQ340_005348 [Diploschistes diacapsis]